MFKFLISLLVFCLISCSQKQEKANSRCNFDNEKKAHQISPLIIKEFENLIFHLDSISTSKIGIVAVIIFKEDQECKLMLATQPFYDSERIKGSLLIGQRLFVFYIENSSCNMGLVNISQLDSIDLINFPNEQNYELLDSYSPFGRIFNIHSQDSLEIKYSGYL